MINTIKIILQLIPSILEIVKAVEAQIPEGGKGKEKLEFVKEVLTSSYPQVTDIWNIVEKIISSAVTLYNATGVFKNA